MSVVRRSLKVAADLNGGVQANRVIGVTSSLPDEGKSTIAANFAAMIADAGSRVILIDADLRKQRLSQSFSPDASTGLVEVAVGETALMDALWTDPGNGLGFLPVAPLSAKLLHPTEFLASTAIKSLSGIIRVIRVRWRTLVTWVSLVTWKTLVTWIIYISLVSLITWCKLPWFS